MAKPNGDAYAELLHEYFALEAQLRRWKEKLAQERKEYWRVVGELMDLEVDRNQRALEEAKARVIESECPF